MNSNAEFNNGFENSVDYERNSRNGVDFQLSQISLLVLFLIYHHPAYYLISSMLYSSEYEFLFDFVKKF
jgi:hypothetical protein